MSQNLPIIMKGNAMKSADQKFCFSCGAIVHHSAHSCPKCGANQPSDSYSSILPYQPNPIIQSSTKQQALPSNHVYCRGCGAAIHESAAHCPKCGAPQHADGQTGLSHKSKDRVTAALFAIFLGSFGAHRFYLGHIGLGFLYLVFCWTWIPGIVGLIEGIVYLTMSDQQFWTKYCRIDF
jgi:TM2 domain-containing membrane protein YozV/RNA polymerase subunit RPABC4/transcription elongation factor Spt4